MIKQYDLKWSGKSADDLFIERLTKVEDPEEIFRWIRQVKEARPRLSDFMDLMAITGIRYNEAVESYNLIISLAKQNKLSDYYNREKDVLRAFPV